MVAVSVLLLLKHIEPHHMPYRSIDVRKNYSFHFDVVLGLLGHYVFHLLLSGTDGGL